MFEPHLFTRDVVDRIRVVLRLKRRFSSYQLIQRYSDSPAVDLLRVAATQEHLRSLVVAGAGIGVHLLVSAPQLHILALPEVYQLHDSELTIVQDVLGLDVPVADALLVDVGQRVEDLVEDEPQAALIESRAEGGKGGVLHDESAYAFPAVEIERLVLDDVVVLELLDVNKISLDRPVMLVLHPQHLHCKLPLALDVDALLHHPVRALAHLLQQLELLLEGVLGVLAFVLLVLDAFEDLQAG